MTADSDCLFCRIVAGDLPADVVRQGERTLAFRDIDPKAPVHVLVIPREHHPDAAALVVNDPGLAAALIADAVAVAEDEGLVEPGYRIVLNTGSGAGQSVFHAHAHVLGGRPLTWPPG